MAPHGEQQQGWAARLEPVAAGVILDILDLVTFGPLGLWLGMALGGVAGWWLAPSLGFRPERRWLCALMAGVYCTLPMTSFLPLGTVASLAAQVLGGRGAPKDGPGGKVIEVDFRVHRDESESEDRDGPAG